MVQFSAIDIDEFGAKSRQLNKELRTISPSPLGINHCQTLGRENSEDVLLAGNWG